MGQEFLTTAGVLFGIIGTIAAIYFSQQNQQYNKKIVDLTQQNLALVQMSNVATIDIKLTNPPPYKSEQNMSEIVVRNVGQKTSGLIRIYAKCSWSEDIEYDLKFPSEGWVLDPNEEHKWKIRFGYKGNIAGHKIVITAETIEQAAKYGTVWQTTEKIL